MRRVKHIFQYGDFLTKVKMSMLIGALFLCSLGVGVSQYIQSGPITAERVHEEMLVKSAEIHGQLYAIDGRMKTMEDQHLGERMTKIEAFVESNRWLLMTTLGGVILIALQGFAGILFKKKLIE